MFFNRMPPFRDRTEAGQKLAELLVGYQNNTVVLAIPRGGIPVAVEIAKRLRACLDVVITRKIPIPDQPEAGYGAVTEDGTIVLNQPLVRQLGFTKEQIERHASNVKDEIEKRIAFFGDELLPESLEDRTVIIVDDGLASGFTMLAAVESIRQRRAAEILVAVPTASQRAYDLVEPKVDDLVCLTIGAGPYFAVASYYADWHDLTDDEVLGFLKDWHARGCSQVGLR